MVEVLYKYMTAERVITCLPEVGDGTLRATQPTALNDPFECAAKPLFVDIGRDELRHNQEFAEVLSSIHGTTPVTAEQVARAKEVYGSLYLRNLFAAQLSQKFGIMSFSEDPRHPLMWTHYTSDGSGFVVGYDVERLAHLGTGEGYLRRITYISDVPPILDYRVLNYPEGNLQSFLCIKSNLWLYESEWRLIVFLDETIGTGLSDARGLPINLVRIPNEAVVKVFHTERTRPDIVDRIRSRLENPNNRYGTSRLTKLVASAGRYEYEDASGQDA